MILKTTLRAEAIERSFAKDKEDLAMNLAKVCIFFIIHLYFNMEHFFTLDEEERFECEYCNRTFRGKEFYEAHKGSKTHRRNLKRHHITPGK